MLCGSTRCKQEVTRHPSSRWGSLPVTVDKESDRRRMSRGLYHDHAINAHSGVRIGRIDWLAVGCMLTLQIKISFDDQRGRGTPTWHGCTTTVTFPGKQSCNSLIDDTNACRGKCPRHEMRSVSDSWIKITLFKFPTIQSQYNLSWARTPKQ
jgi:hypothetical protein